MRKVRKIAKKPKILESKEKLFIKILKKSEWGIIADSRDRYKTPFYRNLLVSIPGYECRLYVCIQRYISPARRGQIEYINTHWVTASGYVPLKPTEIKHLLEL